MKLPKVKHWYHATTLDNAHSILKDGYLKPAIDGIYFANTAQNASTFMRMRGEEQWAVIKVPSKSINHKLRKSFDHCFKVPDGCHFAVYDGGKVSVDNNMITVWEAAE